MQIIKIYLYMIMQLTQALRHTKRMRQIFLTIIFNFYYKVAFV
jgi:hypothetical protein